MVWLGMDPYAYMENDDGPKKPLMPLRQSVQFQQFNKQYLGFRSFWM
jgi:hypothetical protein